MPTPLKELIVDFSGCDHLDAEAVDALGSVLDRAIDGGATISMTGVSANVRVILGIAGLLELAESHGPDSD
jgi:anti-anti-sigma regulatory factor